MNPEALKDEVLLCFRVQHLNLDLDENTLHGNTRSPLFIVLLSLMVSQYGVCEAETSWVVFLTTKLLFVFWTVCDKITHQQMGYLPLSAYQQWGVLLKVSLD